MKKTKSIYVLTLIPTLILIAIIAVLFSNMAKVEATTPQIGTAKTCKLFYVRSQQETLYKLEYITERGGEIDIQEMKISLIEELPEGEYCSDLANLKLTEIELEDAYSILKTVSGFNEAILEKQDLNFDNKVNVKDLAIAIKWIVFGITNSEISVSEISQFLEADVVTIRNDNNEGWHAVVSEETTTTTYEEETTVPETKKYTAEEQYIEEILKEFDKERGNIPLVQKENGLIEEPHVYLFENNAQKYAYTLLSNEINGPLIINPLSISKMHIWKYEGDESCKKILPKTDSTFQYGGEVYPYNLKDKVTKSDIVSVAKNLVNGTISKIKIERFDYNLSNSLDREDLKIMLDAYSANIFNSVPVQEELFSRYLSSMKFISHENILISFSSEIKEYSYLVPCTDLLDNFEGKTWICPVQVIPLESMEMLISKGYSEFETSDKDPMFIIWRPNEFVGSWARVSEIFENWLFSGYYIQEIDQEGLPIKSWVEGEKPII